MKNYRSQLTAIWIVCAVVFLAFVGWKAKSWITSWRTNYVVGTFQGTFSLDETRVRIPADKTGLVVAKIEGHGPPTWMRSFSGLSPGRAAAHVVLPDLSVVVAGVFERELRSNEGPASPLLSTDDKQGVFTLQIGSDGSVIAQKLLASGDEFKTPVIRFHDDRLIVDVRYRGKLSVGGKATNEGTKSPALHLELSPNGELMRWDASGGETTGAAEQGAPNVPKVALMSASGTCEVCHLHTATNDPNCVDVRDNVCNAQGDTWCCNTDWDRICENEGFDAGTSFGVANVVCTCAHGARSTGELLPPQCDPTGCVRTVDDNPAAWACGWSYWSSQCVTWAKGC
jgi:hypothetical protein